jgi:hypothetical protein
MKPYEPIPDSGIQKAVLPVPDLSKVLTSYRREARYPFWVSKDKEGKEIGLESMTMAERRRFKQARQAQG